MQETSKPKRQPDAYNKWEKRQAVIILIEDKFEWFINDPPGKLLNSTSVLDWWLNLSNCINYPSLYCIAIGILSIPPMSVKPK